MLRIRKLFYARLALLFILALAVHISRIEAQTIANGLGREADAQAQSLIKRIVQSGCGTDFFSKRHSRGISIDESSTYFWQYKGLTWSIAPTQVSEADQLNGIEFSGSLFVKARVYRWYYNSSSSMGSPQWSGWQGFKGKVVKFNMEKKNGGWSVLPESLTQEIGNEAPSCEELKQIVPEAGQKK